MINKHCVEQIANLAEWSTNGLPLREHHLLSRQRYCDWQGGVEQTADSIGKRSVCPLPLHTSEENCVSKPCGGQVVTRRHELCLGRTTKEGMKSKREGRRKGKLEYESRSSTFGRATLAGDEELRAGKRGIYNSAESFVWFLCVCFTV